MEIMTLLPPPGVAMGGVLVAQLGVAMEDVMVVVVRQKSQALEESSQEKEVMEGGNVVCQRSLSRQV